MRGPSRDAYAAFDERLQIAVDGSADAAAAIGVEPRRGDLADLHAAEIDR